MTAPSTVSLIATVLNEGDNIHHLLQSIAGQTRPPDEVLIVDGGSRDHTVAILREYETRLPLRVIVAEGCNISAGRNIAIREARGELIAATDAGVRLDPDWLAHLIAPFEASPEVAMVGGFFVADPQTTFELAMGATVLPLVDEIDPPAFLPSSRSVAFRRAAALAVGGYPEWLDYCEDLIFDLRMRASIERAGGRCAFAPGAVAHFRPRGSLRAFYRQYYLYARGDGKADLWRKRHAIRYATYGVALPAFIALAVLWSPVMWGALLAGGVAYTARPYRRLARLWGRAPRRTPADALQAIALVPLIRVVGDVAKMIGYPAGWRWRLRHRPPGWRW